MEIGVTVLPHFPKDSTDRNRTSPFAFTGNKFEFRMLGSAFSIAGPNIVLNTAVAEILSQFADNLSKAKDFNKAVAALVKKTYHDHKRIVFNGNNYAEEWVTEAAKRRLSNLKSTAEALPQFGTKKSVELFGKHNVFSETEVHSRCEILTEVYCKTLNIEALCMIDIVKGLIFPACIEYQTLLAKLYTQKERCDVSFDTTLEKRLLESVSRLSGSLIQKLEALENVVVEANGKHDAKFYQSVVFGTMTQLRLVVDELETLVGKKYWPLPSYADMLTSV